MRILRKLSTKLMAYSMLAATSVAVPLSPNAAEIYQPKAVVELFTSQGCSSCPPADRALHELVKSRDYLGLAFHVDYWDRLGWKDTFGSPENTKRQWAYARAMNERSVYTPQAVINGRDHVVGSRGAEIVNMANIFAAAERGMSVPIEVTENNGRLSVSVGPQNEYKDATLYAVYFKPEAKVKIERGELAGHTLSYTNIVHKVEMLGMSGSNGMQAEFSVNDIKNKGFAGCALILQSKSSSNSTGAIIGASVITDL